MGTGVTLLGLVGGLPTYCGLGAAKALAKTAAKAVIDWNFMFAEVVAKGKQARQLKRCEESGEWGVDGMI